MTGQRYIESMRDGREIHKFPARTLGANDGGFIYKDLDPGIYKFVIGAPGFAPKILENVNVRSDLATDLGTIVLDEGGRITGYILEAGTGNPVASAHVKVLGGMFVTSTGGFGPRKGAATAASAEIWLSRTSRHRQLRSARRTDSESAQTRWETDDRAFKN